MTKFLLGYKRAVLEEGWEGEEGLNRRRIFLLSLLLVASCLFSSSEERGA